MNEQQDSDWETFLADGIKLHSVVWDVVGNDLPEDLGRRLMAELARLGDPAERTEETADRVERLLHVRDGLLAAHHHRDRIEVIEREIVRALRDAYPSGREPGGTASVRMPVVAHEYIAYLFAARRTLDYLALGVSACFGRKVYSIKDLAKGIADATPRKIANQVAAECDGLPERFVDLLTEDKGRLSERDTAAHYAPIEPAYLLVVFFPDGRVGIELQDGGRGHLPGMDTLDPVRMTTDEPRLTASIDRRLDDLAEFCVRLVGLGVDAELGRLAAIAERDEVSKRDES
jgi:hypothetical protein